MIEKSRRENITLNILINGNDRKWQLAKVTVNSDWIKYAVSHINHLDQLEHLLECAVNLRSSNQEVETTLDKMLL